MSVGVPYVLPLVMQTANAKPVEAADESREVPRESIAYRPHPGPPPASGEGGGQQAGRRVGTPANTGRGNRACLRVLCAPSCARSSLVAIGRRFATLPETEQGRDGVGAKRRRHPRVRCCRTPSSAPVVREQHDGARVLLEDEPSNGQFPGGVDGQRGRGLHDDEGKARAYLQSGS